MLKHTAGKEKLLEMERKKKEAKEVTLTRSVQKKMVQYERRNLSVLP